jgi:hypothetical protein
MVSPPVAVSVPTARSLASCQTRRATFQDQPDCMSRSTGLKIAVSTEHASPEDQTVTVIMYKPFDIDDLRTALLNLVEPH